MENKFYKITGNTTFILAGILTAKQAKEYGEGYGNVYRVKEITGKQALALSVLENVPIVDIEAGYIIK